MAEYKLTDTEIVIRNADGAILYQTTQPTGIAPNMTSG